jgi:hypothetical protein
VIELNQPERDLFLSGAKAFDLHHSLLHAFLHRQFLDGHSPTAVAMLDAQYGQHFLHEQLVSLSLLAQPLSLANHVRHN